PPPAPAATSAPRRAGLQSSHRSKRPAEKRKRAMVRPAAAPDKTVESREQKNRRSDSGSDWCLRRRRVRGNPAAPRHPAAKKSGQIASKESASGKTTSAAHPSGTERRRATHSMTPSIRPNQAKER